jgi:hypothetical protein
MSEYDLRVMVSNAISSIQDEIKILRMRIGTLEQQYEDDKGKLKEDNI